MDNKTTVPIILHIFRFRKFQLSSIPPNVIGPSSPTLSHSYSSFNPALPTLHIFPLHSHRQVPQPHSINANKYECEQKIVSDSESHNFLLLCINRHIKIAYMPYGYRRRMRAFAPFYVLWARMTSEIHTKKRIIYDTKQCVSNFLFNGKTICILESGHVSRNK